MYINNTACCALFQLAGVHNGDSPEEIVKFIEEEFTESFPGIFAVTTPEEKALSKTLASIGFKKNFLFPRTEEPGILTLWVALVSDIKLKPKAVKRKAAKRKPRRTR